MAAKKSAKKKVTLQIDAEVLRDLATALKSLGDLHAAVTTCVEDPAERAALTKGAAPKKRAKKR
jgi:hypothetical protein